MLNPFDDDFNLDAAMKEHKKHFPKTKLDLKELNSDLIQMAQIVTLLPESDSVLREFWSPQSEHFDPVYTQLVFNLRKVSI